MNMYKHSIVLALSISMVFYGFAGDESPTDRLNPRFIPGVRLLVHGSRVSIVSIIHNNSPYVILDSDTKMPKELLDSQFFQKKIPQIDNFYSSPQVLKEYEPGMPEYGKLKFDLDCAIDLLCEAQMLPGIKRIYAPYLRHVAQEIFPEKSEFLAWQDRNFATPVQQAPIASAHEKVMKQLRQLD